VSRVRTPRGVGISSRRGSGNRDSREQKIGNFHRKNPGKIGTVHLWRRVADIEASGVKSVPEVVRVGTSEVSKSRRVQSRPSVGTGGRDRESIGIPEIQKTRIRD
jgi:hypothetical protein